MRWLLFQRVSDTEWEPAFGPLSQFAHGAVMYAILLGWPGCLVYGSLRQIRAGKKEYKAVLWWAILAWPLTLLIGSFHVFAIGSRAFLLVWALVGIVCVPPWLIYGVWRVVPLLRRRGDRTGADHLPV